MRRVLLLALTLVPLALASTARAQDAPPADATEPAAEPAAAPTAEPAAEPTAEPTAEGQAGATTAVTAPPPTPPTPPTGVVAAYEKGLVVMSADGRFHLKANIRTQARFDVTRPDDSDEVQARFLLPRVRLTLDGHAHGEVGYKLEFSFGDQGFAYLRDFYVERRLAREVRLRLGQFKRPFDRQELVSDFSTTLADRSIANDLVGAGRDLGIALHDNFERSPHFEWVVGVFNGSGDRPRFRTTCEPIPGMPAELRCTTRSPTNTPEDLEPTIVARVGYNHGGIKGYSEGDLEGGPLRFAIGAAYLGDLGDLAEDAQRHNGVVDFMLKAHGFDLSGGAYVTRPAGDASDPRYAGYAQAGYFLRDVGVILVGRGALAEVETGDPSDAWHDVVEARGGFAWLLEGHAWKWSADVGTVRDRDAGSGILEARTFVQLVF